MNSLIRTAAASLQESSFAALLLDASLKSFAVLALVGILCLCWRRTSAATRHWLWFLAAVSSLCLPWLPFVLPTWQRPLLAVSTDLNPGNQFTLVVELAARKGMDLPSHQAKGPVAGMGSLDDASSGSRQRITTRFHAQWLVVAPVIWFTGVLSVWSFGAIGQLRLRMIRRRAQTPRTLDWMPLFRELCEGMQLRRPVRLLQSDAEVMPMTWGSWHPVVLLPAGADRWPVERRRVVLLHELAHIRRWDCLTQTLTRMVCALYWFNPLVWLASRRMSVERERACDDLVLNGGCKASDYASHLLDIARTFRRVPQVAAIAMARSQQLEHRIAAIVDGSRARALRPAIACTILGVIAAFVLCVGGCSTQLRHHGMDESRSLRQQQIARLEGFSAAKERQSRAFAAQDGDPFFPDFQTFFQAAVKGDGRTVTNMYENFKKRHGQYENATDDLPHTSYWSPVLEVALAYYDVMVGEPTYLQVAIDGIIQSVPAGSIYFGGTDPGRGLPTAFSRSQIDADPFFTLTQNALADGTYLQYLRRTYAGKIYTPTEEDSQKCFAEYIADAERRLKVNKLKPGENVTVVEGKVQVRGQVAVMTINALLAKIIFEKNPNREFYIEESFPLDWMYPHLSPNGLILKINREPQTELAEETIKKDREYWRRRVAEMIGDWLTQDTSVRTITEFVEKVHANKNLHGFRGDPRFIRNQNAQKMFSKFRSSIAGVYAWRVGNQVAGGGEIGAPEDRPEQERMFKEADFAFRQAFAICPHSPEAVFRYVNFLLAWGRLDDAVLIADAALKVEPNNKTVQNLVKELNNMRSSTK